MGMKKAGGRACELCSAPAAVHCEADAAYLCRRCDARVHGANFLAARHVRRVACGACGAVSGRRLSGTGSTVAHRRSLCPSCRLVGEDLSSTSSSSSSSLSCISTAESSAAPGSGKPAVAARSAAAGKKADGVLARWARSMGLVDERRCAEMAFELLGSCGREMLVLLPPRMALAAALWHAVKACGEDGEVAEGREGGSRPCEAALRRLEACAGVPARLIILTEARLARAARRTRVQAVEGWAECS